MKLKQKINMEIKKYKIRCRKNGIIVCLEKEMQKYDVIWKRIFNPKIYPKDKCKDKT